MVTPNRPRRLPRLGPSSRAIERGARGMGGCLESVRRLHEGLQTFLSMSRMEARRRKASAL